MDGREIAEDTIDLSDLKKIVIENKGRLLALVVATTLFAGIIAFSLPKQYESTVLVRAKSQKTGGGISLGASSAIALLGGAMPNPNQSYIEMMKSRSVLEPVIAQLDLPDKEKIQVKDFAKDYLKIVNTKGTDLIEIAAAGRSPEEAQKISNLVIDSFQKELTHLNQSEQSLMGKFLKDRIVVAKKEMEQAESNLEKFRQQEKIYAPDEQAKAFVQKMITYDQQIAQFQVQVEQNTARLQAVMSQIGKQNADIARYNLADHPTIAAFRARIVEKKLELFSQEQLYTAKHPGVIRLKQEIEELNGKLQQEVSILIKAGTSTLNPIHAALLSDKTTTEVGLYVSQASFDGLKRLQADNEAEIKKLSTNGITYVGLARQMQIANEVYAVLIRQYEQTKIQEAMESMDIQIVDIPNLPKRHSGPKRALITAVGGVLGVMLAISYLIWLYIHRKQELNLSI